MFSSMDKDGVLALREQSPWLELSVGDKGHLLQKIIAALSIPVMSGSLRTRVLATTKNVEPALARTGGTIS